MFIHLKEDDASYGTKYTVGTGIYNNGTGSYNRTYAFEGTLESADPESFWFRVDGKITKVNQDFIVWMIPIKENRI